MLKYNEETSTDGSMWISIICSEWSFIPVRWCQTLCLLVKISQWYQLKSDFKFTLPRSGRNRFLTEDETGSSLKQPVETGSSLSRRQRPRMSWWPTTGATASAILWLPSCLRPGVTSVNLMVMLSQCSYWWAINEWYWWIYVWYWWINGGFVWINGEYWFLLPDYWWAIVNMFLWSVKNHGWEWLLQAFLMF